ncbi:MAG: LPS export ABC transporter ATP-binding protein [candidate division NC10 bacterium]|nr:LPS export ABC transporter ATP-binding protein [candidate division NC10 bacterium]
MPSSTPGATPGARPSPEAAPGAILRTVDLAKAFRGRTVVSGVSITVGAGEVVGLLGPNGAGKTTTFYMALGLLQPDRGQVFLNGEEVTTLPVYQRARRGLGFLPQEPSIFRKLTVEENLLAILEGLPLSGQARRERAGALLRELGIAHLAGRKAYTLSGGERRRAEISRCLATDPACILMDEPFAGIDPIAVEEIQGIIAQLRARGIGILITDHNVRETLQIVDRADIIHRGEILISGTARELAADERAREIYLGERFTL